jgi:hypothetical protein
MIFVLLRLVLWCFVFQIVKLWHVVGVWEVLVCSSSTHPHTRLSCYFWLLSMCIVYSDCFANWVIIAAAELLATGHTCSSSNSNKGKERIINNQVATKPKLKLKTLSLSSLIFAFTVYIYRQTFSISIFIDHIH